jgi:hypothetical protein
VENKGFPGNVNVSLYYTGIINMIRKRFLFVVVFIISLSALWGEGAKDSTVVQRQYAFSDFSSLSIKGSFRVRVLKSENWDIKIACERIDLNSIKLRKKSNVFEISMKDGSSPVVQSPVIIISMPLLESLAISGPVQMEIGGFSSQSNMSITQGAGSFLNINGFECAKADFLMEGPSVLHAFLSADDIHIKSSGSTTVRMGGRALNLSIESDEGAKIDGSLLLVDTVNLDLVGVSEIRITPDVELNIKSTGKAMIYYKDEYMDTIPVSEGSAILRKY